MTEPALEQRARAAGAAQRARALFTDSPSLAITLICTVVFVVLGGLEGGFEGTVFLPTALLMLALMVVSLLALPRPSPSRPAAVAAALLGAYAVWSYLSILWADQQGLAWDGANRTLLYALVFALFALWPLRAEAAAALLILYGLGVAGLGFAEFLRAAGSTNPIAFFFEGRLSEPTGYANANVALWFTAFWPCAIFAGRRELTPPLRGLLLAGAGVLTALAVLGQSRSWEAVVPLAVVLAIAMVPGRGRTIGALGLLGLATAYMLRPLLDTYDRFDARTPPSAYFGDARRSVLVAAAALLVAGTAWGLIERRLDLGARARRRVSAVAVALLLAGVAAGAAAFVVREGSPVTRAESIWSDFKKGGSEPDFKGSRFGLQAGSYRYDFFRVAWINFKRHPLAGVGMDNFGRQYLVLGRQDQTPLYPHSIELRVLSMTGIVGVLLFGGALVAALMASATALRRSRPTAGVAAATGVMMFAYFILHGSLDWLWEFPALGGAAFAALGIAATVDRPPSALAYRLPRPAIVVMGVLGAILAVSLTLPWLAERDLRQARRIAGHNPAGAVHRLERAAGLNPLSPIPLTTAAVIEVGRGRVGAGERLYERALRRDPGDPFAYLQLGAIASAANRPARARALVARARRLFPRDVVTIAAQRRLRRGLPVTPARLDRLILRDIDRRIGPG